jgi:hypothetical protein
MTFQGYETLESFVGWSSMQTKDNHFFGSLFQYAWALNGGKNMIESVKKKGK